MESKVYNENDIRFGFVKWSTGSVSVMPMSDFLKKDKNYLVEEYEVEEKYKIRYTSINQKTRNYEATLLFIGTQEDCEAYAKQPVEYTVDKSRNKTINKQVSKDRNPKDLEIEILKESLNECKKKVSTHESKIKDLEEENKKLKQLSASKNFFLLILRFNIELYIYIFYV